MSKQEPDQSLSTTSMQEQQQQQIEEENHSTVNTTTIHLQNQHPHRKSAATTVDDDTSTAHSTILNVKHQHQKRRSNLFNYIWGDIYASDDPNQYSQRKKNVIILLVALGGLCGPLSSMMYMPGILAVAQDLHTSISAVNGTISAFVVFMGISVSPFFLESLSDKHDPSFLTKN